MQIPPSPPPYPTSAFGANDAMPAGPRPWSALAITAFVCSLIGFFGFTAVLGILLGIVGIVVTKEGVRRGRGLAIAAIPISLVTGSIGALMVLGFVSLGKMTTATRQVEAALASSADEGAKKIDFIMANSTVDFQQKVGREKLVQWVAEVNKKHGKLVELDRAFKPGTMTSSRENAVLSYPGKFVNGQALLQVHFEQRSLTTPLIDNIEVDGLSPRGSETTPES